jgi:Tfp pilus assembly protein PilE
MKRADSISYSNSKNAFTMIELIFTVVFTGILSISAYHVAQSKQKQDDLEAALQTIELIAEKFIFDSNSGYMRSTILTDCTPQILSAVDISAIRVKKCAGLGEGLFVEELSLNDTDGTQSYIKLFNGYGESTAEGIRMYIDEDSSSSLRVNLYFEILTDNKARIEQEISAYFIRNSPTLYVNTMFEALSLSQTTGGTMEDGKILIILKG